jgi:hypothetical protein
MAYISKQIAAFVLGTNLIFTCYAKTNDSDLGIVPIGGLPEARDRFVSSDCGGDQGFSDCSAVDAEGRQYAFFDGALIRVSARAGETKNVVRLPMGMRFGEDIKAAGAKVARQLGIKLERTIDEKGVVVYASGFVIKSKNQWYYSIELVSDNKNHLVEIVERANLP